MEQANAGRGGEKHVFESAAAPAGTAAVRPWHCVGVCALALGLGIFIAAVFPVGALMFLVAFLLIFCGIGCLRRF